LAKVGVLAAGRLALGPGPGEAVVGLATEQDGVGRAESGVNGGTHLVVEYGKCHWSGASTTPSSEMNRPVVIFLLMLLRRRRMDVPLSAQTTRL
jgi:hypothetical protein